jgi:hypothetical protein
MMHLCYQACTLTMKAAGNRKAGKLHRVIFQLRCSKRAEQVSEMCVQVQILHTQI